MVRMEHVIVQLPKGLKVTLDGLRRQGTSLSGFIRSLVDRDLNQAATGQKGRCLMATDMAVVRQRDVHLRVRDTCVLNPFARTFKHQPKRPA